MPSRPDPLSTYVFGGEYPREFDEVALKYTPRDTMENAWDQIRGGLELANTTGKLVKVTCDSITLFIGSGNYPGMAESIMEMYTEMQGRKWTEDANTPMAMAAHYNELRRLEGQEPAPPRRTGGLFGIRAEMSGADNAKKYLEHIGGKFSHLGKDHFGVLTQNIYTGPGANGDKFTLPDNLETLVRLAKLDRTGLPATNGPKIAAWLTEELGVKFEYDLEEHVLGVSGKENLDKLANLGVEELTKAGYGSTPTRTKGPADDGASHVPDRHDRPKE